MSGNERIRLSERISGARLVVAIPAAIVALLFLYENLSPYLARVFGRVVYLFLLLVAPVGCVCLWRKYLAGSLSRWLVMRGPTAHLNQPEARTKAKHYANRLRHDAPLLHLSVREFARETAVSLLRAWAILENPDIIARPDLQERIEKALLLPPGFFWRGRAKDGTKYGDAMTRARLQRFFDRRLVKVHLMKNDPRMWTRGSRARLLYKCEKERIKSLKEQGRLEGDK